MRRRKKQAPHASHERWLVSYADFITLLFAFFVVLYASSQVDQRKVGQVARAIQVGFADLGMFSAQRQEAVFRVEAAAQSPAISPPAIPQFERLVNDMSPASGAFKNVPISQVKRQLESILHDEILKKQIEMRVVPDGLVVSLREVGFFKSGDAHLLPGAEPVLAHVGQALASRGFDIRVEGHTDDLPIHTAAYRSNWELSTARATEVVSVLIARYNFDPARISVAGYAQYRPLASNVTEGGRSKNRRIDMVVLSGPADESDMSPKSFGTDIKP
jgi:chemotaxis protein MotB